MSEEEKYVSELLEMEAGERQHDGDRDVTTSRGEQRADRGHRPGSW